MKTIKKLFTEYREQIVYIFFGVLTTAVNLLTFHVCEIILGQKLYLISNIAAWVLSVAFAFVTNKLWVFESKSWQKGTVLKEIPAFVSARVFSFLVEEFGLYVLVDVLSLKTFSFDFIGYKIYGTIIAKIVLAVVVVVINYIFSKFIVFRRKEG